MLQCSINFKINNFISILKPLSGACHCGVGGGGGGGDGCAAVILTNE